MDYIDLTTKIIASVGGKQNIKHYTSCMTRLRLTIIDDDKVNYTTLKEIEGVLGIKENGDELQIILGPGKSTKACDAVKQIFARDDSNSSIIDTNTDINNQSSFENKIKKQKDSVKAKRTSSFQGFMSKFSNIFVPLIPAFIACGLLAGLSGLLKELGVTGDIMNYINVFNKSLVTFMYIMIGFNASVAFGGTGALGGVLAGLFKLTYADGGSSGMQHFMGMAVDPRGGLIGVLIAGILSAYVEKFIRKRLSWEHTDIITTPILTLLITGTITYGIIMPISLKMFDFMNWAFISLNANPIGTGILAALFLPAVLMGIHQGFVPVYEGLVTSIGMNTLFPILGMAGAGQVGASIALYVRSKKGSKIRDNIRGAIIPGFLGVGEPLIYGITLPRVKPFFTSMLGGAVGGIYIGVLAKLNLVFGLNTVFGASGLLGSFAMTSNHGVGVAIALYLSALVVSYIAGFIITYLFGTKNVDLS